MRGTGPVAPRAAGGRRRACARRRPGYRAPVTEGNVPSTQSAEPRETKPPKPPIQAGRILAGAARVGRRDPWRILGVAIAVTLASVLAEIVADHVVDEHSAWQTAVAGVLTEGLGLLGTVFLSGFLCRLTGGADRGPEPVAIREVLRTLPWWRLVAADLTVVLLVVAGLIALVIPGLVMANLLAVAGPVIEIEDRPVRVALRRSARLVRPYFWRVALLATVPVIVVSELESAGPEPTGAPEILETLAIRGVAAGVVEAVIGLILVQLCYRLIALDAIRAQERDTAPAPS
jgi:hypothetical protein